MQDVVHVGCALDRLAGRRLPGEDVTVRLQAQHQAEGCDACAVREYNVSAEAFLFSCEAAQLDSTLLPTDLPPPLLPLPQHQSVCQSKICR